MLLSLYIACAMGSALITFALIMMEYLYPYGKTDRDYIDTTLVCGSLCTVLGCFVLIPLALAGLFYLMAAYKRVFARLPKKLLSMLEDK